MKINENLYAFIWKSMSANNCNTFIINGSLKIIIDPGHLAHFDHVRVGMKDLSLDVGDIDLVICTHAHPDHLESVSLFKQANAKIAMHEYDWRLVESYGAMMGSSFQIKDYVPDIFLTEGSFRAGDMEFDVFHTPGHSPGSITLFWKDPKAIFTGDLIFKDGLGRTDLPGGNGEQLKKSIQEIAKANAEIFLPGHGDIIMGKSEIKENFLKVMNLWFAYI